MRNVRILGLCLVAAFVIAAVEATGASATNPEFGQCYAKPGGGNYADAGCTKPKPFGKGTFEWRTMAEITANKSFRENESVTHKGVLNANYISCSGRIRRAGSCASHGEKDEKSGPLPVECQNEFHRGLISGSKEVAHVGVAFEHCAVLGSAPCANTPTEEIQTNPLKGNLEYIKRAPKEVGLLLTPEKAPEAFAQFNCLGVISVVVGEGNAVEGTAYKEANGEENKGGNDGLIAPIAPINMMVTNLVQTYTFNAKLENVPSKFVGGQRESLETYEYSPFESAESSEWSKAGQEVTAESQQEDGEEIEIKA